MSKIKLEKVLNLLLSEGKDAATPLMHQYVIETCLEINDKILREDEVEMDVDSTPEDDSTSVPSILTVFYKDPEGDCSYDQAILDVLGREDFDGAAWDEGIRTLVFQFHSEDEADDAAETLENAQGEGSDLPDELTTDVTDITFDDDDGAEESEDETTDTTEVEECNDNASGNESPLSDTKPEEVEESDEVEGQTEEDPEFSDIFKNPEESTDDKVLDLAAEIEDLKRQIAELGNDETVSESYELESVKPVDNQDGDLSGNAGKIKTNDKSVIPGDKDISNRDKSAKPMEIGKGEDHKGYDRQPAPAIKTLKPATNTRTKATDGMEKVSKEGDKSALINQTPKGNDKSIIA